MGIEKFFNSIKQHSIANLNAIFTSKFKNALKADEFYVDFNSIIHMTSREVNNELNLLLMYLINERPVTGTTKANEIITKYHIDETNLASVKLFVKYINKNINQYIIHEVIEYVYNLIKVYLDTNQLKLLYLGIDGVPTKAKAMEQKKRRYFGEFSSAMEDQLFQKYIDELKQYPKKLEYEKNKFSWNRMLITTGTLFMLELSQALQSKSFINGLKQVAPKLKKYILSTQFESGEAEKKIFNYIETHANNNQHIVIYSPDMDMTLLGMLLTKKNVNVLRFNQQELTFDVIDIDVLEHNIFEYVRKHVQKKLIAQRVSDDIVFVFTVFGNDFLPKMDSINIKYDFKLIIDLYCQSLSHNDYILDVKRKINLVTLMAFFKEISNIEESNLRKNFMRTTFSNYMQIAKVLDPEDNMDFETIMQKFNSFVKKYAIIKKNFDSREAQDLLNQPEFVDELFKFSLLKPKHRETFVNDLKNFYHQRHKLPHINIYLKPFTYSIKDDFHQQRVKKLNLKYERELYQFENLLDDYRKKLNVSNIVLGRVFVNKDLTWTSIDIQKDLEYYHKTFYGNRVLNDIIKQYLAGLTWLQHYYYGKEFLSNTITSNWSYPYLRVPFVSQIYFFLDGVVNKLSKLSNNLEKYILKHQISSSSWLTPVQQLTYVTPLTNNTIDFLPVEYQAFFKKEKIDSKYFINLAKKIITGEKTNEISCHGVIFLTKCIILLSKSPNYYHLKFDDFVTKLNKIKLTKSSERNGKNMKPLIVIKL